VSRQPQDTLRRALDLIDANIEERVSPKALAQLAGISRMYFAPQFCTATAQQTQHDWHR
jgi:AraC-like DNA-binding protein